MVELNEKIKRLEEYVEKEFGSEKYGFVFAIKTGETNGNADINIRSKTNVTVKDEFQLVNTIFQGLRIGWTNLNNKFYGISEKKKQPKSDNFNMYG